MFITFEGIDGSGKSTQAQLLHSSLTDRGYSVRRVREPGGTDLGESIRKLLLDPESVLTPRAELLLFSASRAQLVESVIEPALSRGDIVIADRFYDSSTAYQGVGRALAGLDWIDGFHQFVTGGRAPDRTYLLSLGPSSAARRRDGREHTDRMEASGKAFFDRVADAYAELAKREPRRITVVDAEETPDRIAETILGNVLTALERRSRGR